MFGKAGYGRICGHNFNESKLVKILEIECNSHYFKNVPFGIWVLFFLEFVPPLGSGGLMRL
jgi:hypothetical protein